MSTDWTEPKYPGDAVRIALLIRGEHELGDVRIQDYGPGKDGKRYRVGTFLPGETECTPGHTPKTWPDKSVWRTTPGEANSTFLEYVRIAKASDWKDYNRETGKAA